VEIIFDDIQNEKIPPEEIDKLKEIIPKIEQSLNENLSNYLQFLSDQENKGNYVEIHWPFFEFSIALRLCKIKDKFLISVLNNYDSTVYGNLLIEGFDCISNDELKKIGKWKEYSGNKSKIRKSL